MGSIALGVGNKGKLANTTRRNEHDDYEEDGNDNAGGGDDSRVVRGEYESE